MDTEKEGTACAQKQVRMPGKAIALGVRGWPGCVIGVMEGRTLRACASFN